MDPTLSFPPRLPRRRVRLDAMNINGKNGLACLTNMNTLPGTIVVLKPLPGLPVIRDLIVDMTQFFKQYHSIKPYLINDSIAARKGAPAVARRARRARRPVRVHPVRQLLHQLPQLLVEPDKFVGPAGLLQAYRFIADSRDQPPPSAWTTWKTRTACSAATPS